MWTGDSDGVPVRLRPQGEMQALGEPIQATTPNVSVGAMTEARSQGLPQSHCKRCSSALVECNSSALAGVHYLIRCYSSIPIGEISSVLQSC